MIALDNYGTGNVAISPSLKLRSSIDEPGAGGDLGSGLDRMQAVQPGPSPLQQQIERVRRGHDGHDLTVGKGG